MKIYTICEKLYDHFESIQEVCHYYGILAIYALIMTAEEKHDSRLLSRCINILNKFPDKITHTSYNFPSYEICGNAKAYAFMKGYVPDSVDQIKKYADEIMNARRDKNGIICHPTEKADNLIWIDIAMAVTPFLLFSGISLKKSEYINESIKQTLMLYDEFIDKSNGLLHQAKNFTGQDLFTQDHWARGNGWGYFSLAHLIEYIDPSHKDYDKIKTYFINHSNALLNAKDNLCLWHQELTMHSSYRECSGSALILYGIGVGLRKGILDVNQFKDTFNCGINNLYKNFVNIDFSTIGCCPGCLCPGTGSEKGSIQAYTSVAPEKDEQHSFGPLMLAFIEASRNGITDLHK